MTYPTTAEILDDFEFFDDWQERYQYIIDLGKSLPEMPESLKVPANLIRGCQSNVWLSTNIQDGKLQLQLDSDAIIVKGLLILVLAAFNDKTASEIIAFDVDDYFSRLDLFRHLSPTRGNGVRAVVSKITEIATEQ
ncbi:SufE family protein [Psychromonas sp. PT13]|uniref:SufE family protein n=1 Tax=Psychromonas sp. PT13 TaxID=3439547 RepID=UPI003EC06899